MKMATHLITPRIVTVARRSLTCDIVRDANAAETLRPEWDALLPRCARTELMHTPDWLLTWWRVFGPLQGRQLRLGVFHDGDRLVGLAPLLRRRHWYRNWLPFRRLEFLASGEPAADGIYSNHLSVLAESGYEEQVPRQLVEAIAAGAFGHWDEVVLPMMSGDTSMPEQLVDSFQAAGYAAELTRTAGAPYIPLPGTWDAYLRDLSKYGRRNIQRSLKAFTEWSNGTMRLECITSRDKLEDGIRILKSLHHERWANDDSAGVFHSPLYLAFHEQMMRTLAERGALELLILHARGEPAAALYSFVWNDKVYAYQSGRRVDVPGTLRPGGVLDALAIRRAIEQGRREFDLQADEVFYKKQFTPHVRPLVQVRAARRCLVEMIRRIGVSLRLRRSAKPSAKSN